MLEIKKDPYVLGFAAIVLVCATALVWHGDVTLARALELVGAALFAPGILGLKKTDGAPPPSLPVLLFAIVLVLPACGHEKAVSTGIDLAGYQADLLVCKAEGKDAGAYAVYEQCAKEADRKHGKKDGAP